MCLSDSQLLEAGEGGRGHGASRNIWLEAVQRHFDRSGTLFQVEGTMHLGDRHYLLPFVKRQASGLGLDISNPQLQVSLPSHPLSQFILKGGDMPQ